MTQRAFPGYAVRAIERLARQIARETGAPATSAPATAFVPADARDDRERVVVLGRPDLRTGSALRTAFGPLTVLDDPDLTAPGEPVPAGVVVALDWLHRLPDPTPGADWLAATGAGHYLLAAPREPLAALGLPLTARVFRSLVGPPGGVLWSGPGLLRFTSRLGGMRGIAAPYPWTVLWVRRN